MIAPANGRAAVRGFSLALAITGIAGAAVAQDYVDPPRGYVNGSATSTPATPGVKTQAETAIRGYFSSDGLKFRAERVRIATSVTRGFDQRIAGPISIVCGEYRQPDAPDDYRSYAWFYVAIKKGDVLWSEADTVADGPSIAYDDCQGAGMTN
jgi:hypothetical protein